MKKKLIAALCVLTLAICLICVTAAADSATAVAVIGNQYFDTLEQAIDAVDAENPELTVITLLKNIDSCFVEKTAYLDLAGCSIGFAEVKSGATLYCLDSATDDYVIEGDAQNGYTGFGRITASDGNIDGVEAGMIPVTPSEEYRFGTLDGYLKVTENTGISFHRVNLQITAMTLRPKNDNEITYNPGIYYKSNFAGDQLVADQVSTFGIALSLQEAPSAYNLGITNQFSWFGADKFQAGINNTDATSTYLKGILKESNSRLTNTFNADQPVFGRAYLQTKNNQYVFGVAVNRTFQEQIELMCNDVNWKKLTDEQEDHVVTLYRKYMMLFREWDVPNMESAVICDRDNPVISGDKNKPLRILAITSSFGKNTTELLYDILTAEGYTDVTLARLYTSGGTLKEHVANATENTEAYQYTYISKDTNGQWIKTHDDAKITNKTLPSASMWDILAQDGGWDVIFLQQSAAHSPQLNTYGTYVDQLMEQLALHNPNHENTKYIWNMTWAYAASFRDDVFARYDNDQIKMYKSCVKAVQEKIVPRTDFEAVTPSGTAIQNARIRHLDDENDLTSDGRHANALGRTVAGYAVYAAITGQPLEQIQLATIKNTDTTYEIDELTLTEDQKAIIVESVNCAIANPFHITEPSA